MRARVRKELEKGDERGTRESLIIRPGGRRINDAKRKRGALLPSSPPPRLRGNRSWRRILTAISVADDEGDPHQVVIRTRSCEAYSKRQVCSDLIDRSFIHSKLALDN